LTPDRSPLAVDPQEALMLFDPQMAQLLATSAKRRPQTPAAPRVRRDLLRGLRLPHRTGYAAAVGRLLARPQRAPGR
jgi:hypothetical protein